MHPEHDPDLEHAFAELHRQQREQAPHLGAMRERALREAEASRHSTRRRFAAPLAWAAAAACVAAIGLWAMGWLPHRPSPQPARNDSMEHVEQLLTSIEQHLDFEGVMSFSEYPTDILLADSQPDPLP
jgi:ferric-dicitrate binding protein FerR (iron transport regulator)